MTAGIGSGTRHDSGQDNENVKNERACKAQEDTIQSENPDHFQMPGEMLPKAENCNLLIPLNL